MEHLQQSPKQIVYWTVYGKNYRSTQPMHYMVCCDSDATFDQLLTAVKRVSLNDKVVSFSYKINQNTKDVFINDDESMKRAIESMKKIAFEPQKGGISIRLHESSRFAYWVDIILLAIFVFLCGMLIFTDSTDCLYWK